LLVKLSVLMPVFNEQATLEVVLNRVLAVEYPCDMELVVVDDASTDGTAKILQEFRHPRLARLTLHTHPVNRGKGAAIRTAAALATGDYVIPCDADLEYRPEEIPLLLGPVLRKEADVVFGNRTFGSHSAYSFWYVIGNKVITTAANVLFNAYIGDLETCYKLLPLALYRDLEIGSDGFGLEAEITAKLLARGIRPYEVPISYRARSREEGKKLTWRDGVEAVWILARERARARKA
jgi:glycosyltransferase involved in cell wall biosynthesis